MKKLRTLLCLAATILLHTHCNEHGRELNIDLDSVNTADTIGYTAKYSGDSLSKKKCIYLTIDDAPANGSNYIDSIISGEKIKTNIFFVGNMADGSHRFLKYYNLLKENPYIEIYNHSYSHANNRYADFYKQPDSVLRDFDKNQNKFNIEHKIARLPGRNLWQIGDHKKNYKQTGAESAALLAKSGYQIFGWDVEWKYNTKDYTPKESIDELVKAIEEAQNAPTTFTANHVVVLMHNQMFAKANGKNDLKELITKLKNSHFTFEYLSSYPEKTAN